MFKNFLFLLGWAVSTAVVAQPYIPGQAYFGANNYIEYLAGNLPLIISVPHGGILLPASIPDRDCDGCSYARDINTQELARAVYEAVHDQTGCWPHVIINRLHRRKLDANRDLPEAADGNPQAELAWTEFHQYIDAAKEATQLQFNKGFYIDLHGHAHDIQRLELGYLLTAAQLRYSDDSLNTSVLQSKSSIRFLIGHNLGHLTHAQMLRGPQSLGDLLMQRGIPSVPSSSDPYPEIGEAYFNGGYNTARHSSLPGGSIDGVQIESHWDGFRDNTANIARSADSLGAVLLNYFRLHYFGPLADDLCGSLAVPPDWTPTVPPLFEIFPNPYCAEFYIRHHDTSGAKWTAQVFDFYGNLLRIKNLEPDVPIEIVPKKERNMYVVLLRNGQVVMMQAVLGSCR